MAFSSSKKARSLAGNVVMEVYSFDAASVTSGTISTGLGTILAVVLNNETTEGQGYPTKSGQTVTLTGLTSSDTGTVIVVGY